jgi:F-type H+-transporting ATPase subunit epsilon
MADKSFKLEIITPTKVIFSGDVTSFSAPGVVGGFQVLYNHAPLLAEIDVGVVKIVKLDGTEYRFATSGGFVNVLDNRVTMLAESVEKAEEIDTDRAKIARDRARQKLGEKLNDIELHETQQALQRALNRIRIAEKQ